MADSIARIGHARWFVATSADNIGSNPHHRRRGAYSELIFD
jgi:hypothetical protein